MASSGWSSLSWYAGSAPDMWCLLGLRLVSLVQGKTYEIWLLFLDFPLCFAWKYSEGIKVESSILERHEWCHIKTPVEGAVRLSSLSCFKGGTRKDEHADFPLWYPPASVSGAFTVTQIPGGLFLFLKKDGRHDLLFPVCLILIIIDHYPPEIETMEMLMLAEINETLMHNRC